DIELVPVARANLVDTLTSFVARGFDVTVELPVRARIFSTSPDDHVLAFVVHHIAADGYSLAPMARDVMTAYTARVGGCAPEWKPLPVQYADFTLWQHDVLGSEDDPESVLSNQLRYWTDTLTGLPDVIQMPTDHPRPIQQSFAGDRIQFDIDADLHAQLTELARSAGASMFMVTHTALAVLLARLGSTDDVVIGTPIAGRGDAALDDMVGMFVNTLVLRNHIDSSATFIEILEPIRETDLGAFGHSDLPFERLVEELNPTRSTSYSPLFQVALEFQNNENPVLELPQLRIEAIDLDTHIAKEDLELILIEQFADDGTPAGVTAGFDFATALFERDTIRKLSERFLLILSAAVEHPATPVGDFGLLDSTELMDLVPARGKKPVPAELWPDLLSRAAVRNPDAVALVYDDGVHDRRVVDYRELDEWSNRLARVLAAQGIGPESFVALGIPRSIEEVVSVWAVAKSGAAFVPVDPTYPAERIDYMLTDCHAMVGLTVSDRRAHLPDTVPWLELDDPKFEARLRSVPADPITDDDRTKRLHLAHPAYLIYTSGSTGKPKGVIVTHRGMANLTKEEHERFGVHPKSVVSHLASPSFDASVFELMMAFGAGARVVIVPPTIYGGTELSSLLSRNEVTHSFITPTALASIDDIGLESLEAIVVAGEACPPDLVEMWAHDRRMFNGYGPTETTIQASVSDPMRPETGVDIGRPARGFGALVLDTRLQPVAHGVPGELYITGPGLARGYHNRFALTADRFVANRFGKPGERMYRTGDVVRWRANDTIEYIGRSDFQVKVRGFRIELGEIDAVLVHHPAIAFAATIGHVGPSGDTLLAAYVRATDGHDVDGAELRAYAAERLPAHMVPAAVVVLDQLPMTPVGKLDLKALPAPEFGTRSEGFQLPTTETERVLVDTFVEILGVDRVSTSDSFFDLGGNSIVATRLVTEIQVKLGKTLSLQTMFLEPTPAGLAYRLDAEAEAADSGAVSPVDEALGVVIPLRATGDKPPLFCVHPGIGLAWGYAGIMQYLSQDRPAFGLQLPTISGGPTFESIEQLAHRYVVEMRRVQPEGPYHLLGWSLGGILAHAMAVELRRAGQQVDTLAVMDSYIARDDDAAPEKLTVSELLHGLGLDIAPAKTSGATETGRSEDERAELTYERAVELLDEAFGQQTGLTAAHLERINTGFTTSSQIMHEFRPQVFDGEMLFFKATESPDAAEHDVHEWDYAVTGGVREVPVPCEHNQMIDPAVLATVGPTLDAYLSTR
ncbi:MAG: amino acid adenylation domain-containing protein, partial [Rhodococcus sp.]|nr:amino acid adenylation domain-containing protein [Rhodococcus sp. (in: high G+C Gram-positive bacteria)]